MIGERGEGRRLKGRGLGGDRGCLGERDCLALSCDDDGCELKIRHIASWLKAQLLHKKIC